VMIPAVYQRHVDRQLGQTLRGMQAREAAAENQDTRTSPGVDRRHMRSSRRNAASPAPCRLSRRHSMSSRCVSKHFREMLEEAEKAQLVETERKREPSGDRIASSAPRTSPRTSRMLFDLESDGRGVTGNTPTPPAA
jgi:hypothetical protein